jgi:hypothetical protein
MITDEGPSIGNEGVDDADVIRRLADRFIAGLGKRPFRPTPMELARVWGGELVRGETRDSRARIAGGRYASLFADHAVQDVSGDGAPGAYARIWLCARLAFIESMGTGSSSPPPGPGVLRWENEGGTAF